MGTVQPKSNGNGDNLRNADGTLEIRMRSEKPEGVPDARVSFSLNQYEINGEKWSPRGGGSSGDGNGNVTLKMPRPPANVKTLKAILTVRSALAQRPPARPQLWFDRNQKWPPASVSLAQFE